MIAPLGIKFSSVSFSTFGSLSNLKMPSKSVLEFYWYNNFPDNKVLYF